MARLAAGVGSGDTTIELEDWHRPDYRFALKVGNEVMVPTGWPAENVAEVARSNPTSHPEGAEVSVVYWRPSGGATPTVTGDAPVHDHPHSHPVPGHGHDVELPTHEHPHDHELPAHDHDELYAGPHEHPYAGTAHGHPHEHDAAYLHEHPFATEGHGHPPTVHDHPHDHDTEYAAQGHSHPHNHDAQYAGTGHTHDTTHDHDTRYALLHSHDYAALVHAHQLADGDIPAGIARDAEVDAKVATHAAAPHGGAASPVYAVLANGATAMALDVNDAVKVTPTANATYTTPVPAAGKTRTIIILTSGTTSRTITFGAGFKPTATLATGTTSGRVFVIRFISDGTNLYEISRTVAMVA